MHRKKFNKNFNKGPQLPGGLQRELDIHTTQQPARPRSSKQDRQSSPPPPHKKQRTLPPSTTTTTTTKSHPRQRHSKPQISSSNFDKLLPPTFLLQSKSNTEPSSAASSKSTTINNITATTTTLTRTDPEVELQRKLAKKLGLKKNKTAMGGDDGLDDLLQELGGITDIFTAGDDDDDDDGDDDEEEEEEEEEDLEDMLVGSSDSEEDESDDDGSLQDSEDRESDDEEESESDEEEDVAPLVMKPKIKQQPSPSTAIATASEGKYLPPAARRALAAGAIINQPATTTNEEEEKIVRRIRGLMNRLTEASIQGIVTDLAKLYDAENRRLVSDQVCIEMLAATAEGPRATERFAAVAAASMAGLAAVSKTQEILANFLSRVAIRLETAAAASGGGDGNSKIKKKNTTTTTATEEDMKQLSSEDGDSLTCHNLVMVISHLFLIKALHSDMIFSLLNHWRERFNDTDLTMMSTLLHGCGLALRSADPVRMKEFVISIHSRAAEVGGIGSLSRRAQIMLQLVVDIKNNRKRHQNNTNNDGSGGTAATAVLSPMVLKWLKSGRVDDVSIAGLKWSRVVEKDKRGRWWLPVEAGDMAPAALPGSSAAAAQELNAVLTGGRRNGVAGNTYMDNSKSDDAILTAEQQQQQNLLAIAAKMKMNTDTKRAIFLVVMSSEDCIDAHEKLIRLGLKGDKERDIIRVTMECCLQEKTWNKYYALLLARLVAGDKNQRITLQYACWDYIKDGSNGIKEANLRKLSNLAKLLAQLIADGTTLPLSVLRVVDFNFNFNGGGSSGGGLKSAKELLFWKVFFEHLLLEAKSDYDSKLVFEKLATTTTTTSTGKNSEKKSNIEGLKKGMRGFLRKVVGPWLAAMEPEDKNGSGGGMSSEKLAMLLKRCRAAEIALLSI
jgi:nucleolar MIF4G domain-containing protein 1